MSVISVVEDRKSESRVDESGFSDVRFFTVTLSAPDSTRVSLGASGIPRIGNVYQLGSIRDFTTRVASKTASINEQNLLIHHVTVSYKVFAGQGSDPGNVEDEPPDPLKKPAEISRDFIESNVPAAYVIKDDGEADLTIPITNSAGQPFPTPPEREVVDEIVTIVRNEIELKQDKMDTFQGAINTTPWYGRAANTCKVKISTRVMREYGKEFEQVTYTIEYRRDGWLAKILDEGYATYDTGDEEHDVARDGSNMPLNEPILLNGSGLKAANNSPTFLEFQLNKRADFNLLKLPRPSA